MIYFIDSFLFNGEDIVNLRLEYLYNYVDKFYIVESIYTFSGIKKDDYYIDKYKTWFIPYLDKIVFIKIDTLLNTLPDKEFQTLNKKCFYEEKLQRNYIRSILLKDFESRKFLLALCDVDEIYNYTIFETKEELYNLTNDKQILLKMKMYYYNFNFFLHDIWEMAFIINDTMLNKYEDLDYIRVYKLGDSTIRLTSGWHFTYFMKPQDILRKLNSFSHADINIYPYNNVDFISFVIKNGIDYQLRNEVKLQNISFEDKIHNYPELFRKYYIS